VNVIVEGIFHNRYRRVGAIHESPASVASFTIDIIAWGRSPRHSPMTIIAIAVIGMHRA
jgi:hypothetical protein